MSNNLLKKSWRKFSKKTWRMIILLFLSLVILFIPLPYKKTSPLERHFRIEASMFQFNPGVIKINPGDRVTIDLVSTDVVHGFSLDEYDVAFEADPGQTKSVTFIADQAGVFRFRCLVPCGNLHPFMIGKLQVGANTHLLRGIALFFMAIIAAVGTIYQSSNTGNTQFPVLQNDISTYRDTGRVEL